MAKQQPYTIKLTQTVKKGGCASKLPAKHLKSILQELSLRSSPHLLTQFQTWDDAAVWDLKNNDFKNNTAALVQTLDFFTPIVDDPYTFGQIAAVNAMSDVYAMGCQPRLTLCILAFPAKTLDIEVIKPLMEGALERIHKAGAVLVGGHTIDDETLKLGFVASGFVDKNHFWSHAKAQIGDQLILTKALGVGTLVSAYKKQNTHQTERWLKGAISSMIQLNNVIDFCKIRDVHAATDVTGFGFLGHACQMAKASGVSFQLDIQQIPQLPGAMDSLKQGHLVKAHYTNADYVKDLVDYGVAKEEMKSLLNDPQTSGGLLLAVPASCASLFVSRLSEAFPCTRVIGDVTGIKNKLVHLFSADKNEC